MTVDLQKKSNEINVNVQRSPAWSPSFINQENDRPKEKEVSKNKLVIGILEAVISVSFFAMFFGIPLFFLNLTLQGLSFEKQMYFYFWVLLAMAAWVTKGIILGEIKIKKTSLDWFILAFFLLYVVSSIFSVDKWHSIFGFFGDPSRGLINIIAIIFAYYLILSNFTKQRLVLILTAVVISTGIAEMWTFVTLFFADKFPTWATERFPLSVMGSATGLGMFFSCVLPLLVTAVYKIIESRKAVILKIIAGIILGMLAIGDLFLLWIIFPFVPWLALLVGVSIFVIFILALIVRPVSRQWSWMAMASFVTVLLILMVGSGDWMLKQKLPIEVSPNKSLSWDVATNSLKDNFSIGNGVASYGYGFSKYRPQNFNDSDFYNLRFYQGTGLFFESLPTIGFFGTASFCLILLGYLGVSIYFLVREKERNKMYSLGFFSAAIVFIIGTLSVRIDGSMLIFGVLVAIVSIAVIQLESEVEDMQFSFSLKASPKYALALAFMFMIISAGVVYAFVFMGKVFAADVYMKKAISMQESSREDSVALMLKAINLYPKEGRYYSRAGQEYMFLANREALKDENSRNVDLIKEYLNSAIALAGKGKELLPNDAMAVEILAQIYENAGLFVAADFIDPMEQSYQKTLELEPHNPVYLIKLGQIKSKKAALASGDEKAEFLKQARDLFKKSIDEKNNYAPGYYYVALVDEALADLDSAVDNMRSAVMFENNNVDYVFGLGRLYHQRGKGDDEKNAEEIYKNILSRNEQDANVRLNLGLLYEKQQKNDAALAEYRKILDGIPTSSKEVRDQIDKMISNVGSGKNLRPENSSTEENNAPIDAIINPQENPPVDATVNPQENPPVDATVNPQENPPVNIQPQQ